MTVKLWSDSPDHRPPQPLIRNPRIDLSRRNVPMPQRPLDEIKVSGLLVEPSGESVAEGMDGHWPADPCILDPFGKLKLDCPGTETTA